jgi:hypothetical protein
MQSPNVASHDNYFFGKRYELLAGERAELEGCSWSRSEQSRGPADLHLSCPVGPNRPEWAVGEVELQVKASRRQMPRPSRVSPIARHRLVAASRRRGARPIIATAAPGTICFFDAANGNALGCARLEPRLRRPYKHEK